MKKSVLTKAERIEARRQEIALNSFPGHPRLARLAASRPTSLLATEIARLNDFDRIAVMLKREAI
ncbi:MAG: hypothetical protein U0235_27815 [Polyangiaceae bacterium]